MTIRQAELNDIPRLQELLAQILEVHHIARPDLFHPVGSKFTDEDLKEVIEDPQKSIFVYEDESGEVQGHLFTIVEETKEESTTQVKHKTLFIDDLCVNQAARGQKIGEQLYQFAIEHAKQLGCYNLTLHVWNDNAGALRFYERLGMKPQYTAMEEIL
ncbi:GNAT family N-acetyltransferase [Streptococcus loxodontisalivarius]|uniref:Ribosomal protein S18 acetylase RimI-like enzyme n=1 Tax=Streptococcus loxodontisalivarius TaxID=1349415 RepID=A0ABS2PQZ3_9STRE|nr:GNAT family N-acetyltransferase [Streptococcus loxodontisalivarius]MBM7642463.1 ribosomal protein S18 acetylase RimI-like enzyme [Streptococcus loxodontisalivarius]